MIVESFSTEEGKLTPRMSGFEDRDLSWGYKMDQVVADNPIFAAI